MILGRAVLALLLAVPLPGPASLRTRPVPKPRLTVGDRFELVLTVRAPEASRVLGPLADSLGVFLVTGQKTKTAKRAGQAESEHRLSLAGFKPGRQALPVFTFLVRAGARTDTLRSAADSVTIASVLPPRMQDVRDLKPAESFPDHRLWAIPGVLLLAAALAWLGRRLYRRLRRAREEALSPLPPWEQALAALDALPWQEWLAAGQVKRCYYALSEILKRYIERRFEFNAVEQTTTEILASLHAYRTPFRDEVGRFLTRADFVKYAKTVPPEEETRAAIQQIRDFVARTTPRPPALPAEAGAGAAPPQEAA